MLILFLVVLTSASDVASGGQPDSVTVEARSLPFVVTRDTIDEQGYVESVQSVRLDFGSPEAGCRAPCFDESHSEEVDLSASAIRILEAYVIFVGAKTPLVSSKQVGDEGVAFKVGPIVLIVLGPVETDLEQPGIVNRAVERGVLVPRKERGRGTLQVRVRNEGQGLLVALRLVDYRSSIRGSRPRARLRELVYKRTQLRAHRWVCVSFLEALADGDLKNVIVTR